MKLLLHSIISLNLYEGTNNIINKQMNAISNFGDRNGHIIKHNNKISIANKDFIKLVESLKIL